MSPAADGNLEPLQWEIIHVPGNPPSTLQQSTVDVIASTIAPKLANNLVRKLNQICPLEDLRHVKRVRRRTTEGKTELSVILCLSQEHVNRVDSIPNDVLQLISAYELSPFNAKVAKYAASSKEEWEEQCKLWPTSYHPPSNNLDGVGGFSEEDKQYIFSYIKDAIRLTRLNHLGGKVVNAAVIVDPSSKQIVASGSDQTGSELASTDQTSLKCTGCTKQTAVGASLQSDANGSGNVGEDSVPKSSPGVANNDKLVNSECLADECSQSYTSVACLYPWAWTEHRPCNQNSLLTCVNNYSWHPLKHAAIVAIENAAARDRQFFPSSGSSEDQTYHGDSLQQPSNDIPSKRQKVQPSDNEDDFGNVLPSESTRPYLCTGFDIYLVWEPCTMCAMALVHQRIRRIFFAFPNPKVGALGSVYRLQGERSLNHHYSVFKILLPEKFLRGGELNCSGDS